MNEGLANAAGARKPRTWLASAVRRTMRTRTGRRCWGVALYASMLGGGIGMVVELWFHRYPIWRAPEAVAMALALVALMLLSRRAMPVIQNNMFERSCDPSIDERQRQVRDRAYRQAYHVVSVLALLSFVAGWSFWNIAVVDHFQEMVTPRHLMALAFFYFMGVMVLVPSLPAACLAWSEPDDVS